MAAPAANPAPAPEATTKKKAVSPEMAREIRLTSAMTLTMRVAQMLAKDGNKTLSRSALKLANAIGEHMDNGNGAA